MLHSLRAVAAALLLSACGGDGGPTGPAGVANVVVSPAAHELTEGEERTLSARVLDAKGHELAGRAVAWSSSDDAVVTVTSAGVVKAVGMGVAWVRAASEGKKDSSAITVYRVPVASVELDAVQLALAEGATRQLVATPKDAAGHALAGRGLQWTTSDGDVAQVGANGLVTALRPGRVTVTVKVEGKSAEASVLVSADYDYDLLYDAKFEGTLRELYRVDVRHPFGMPARLMPNLPASDVTPSPDGSRIAFVITGPENNTEIYVANADGSGLKRLTDNEFGDDQPAWSPDGKKIAFRSDRSGDSWDIWVMNADGSGAVNLTPDPLPAVSTEAWPAWSPDGSRIAYASDIDDYPGSRIWTMRADGTDRRAITVHGAHVADQPAWSPDGQTIAFRKNDAVFSDIFLVNATGGNERRLMPVDLAFNQDAPAWSPDGKLIAFASRHEGGNYQIYTVWADGSKLARRTPDESDKRNPSWIRRLP